MSTISGAEILAKALRKEGTEHLFYLMGGPMLRAENSCMREGIVGIDVRHEQAAAMMAHAYTRLQQRPAVCMAASGPGVINLATGLANAFVDCAPVIAIGGASPSNLQGRQAFQEIDQVAMMKPCTKWSERVHHIERIPEMVNIAFQRAMAGKPGPVYLDFTANLLVEEIEEDKLDWSLSGRRMTGVGAGEESQIQRLMDAIRSSRRPVIIAGSGVIWSKAWSAFGEFVEASGIPFYTTPQARGILPDDHRLSFLAMRSAAFRDADLVIVLGTRMNYMLNYGAPPRFSASATIARIDIDADEIATTSRPVDIGIVGDCAAVLKQLTAAIKAGPPPDLKGWVDVLSTGEKGKRAKRGQESILAQEPIHPIRLCAEVRDFMRRDAILVVDGQEILNYGRQEIPTFEPAHRLNSGPFGTMGVGLPFGIGAKIAKPQSQVIVLSGDGAFGFNAMELDTAIRHKVPLLVVISLNGGWSASVPADKPGRDLGYTRFEALAQSLGCHGEYVERPEDIRPALDRAQRIVDEGGVALVNVKTDSMARAATQQFTLSMT